MIAAIDIVVIKRGSDFMAHVRGNTKIWEAGATEDEASGKLYRRVKQETDDILARM